MYPYHYFRGPSRLVWFLIGAGTATWFIKYKDANERQFGHCRRPQLRPESLSATAPPQTDYSTESQQHPYAHRRHWSSHWEVGLTPDEKEKFAAFSNHAADSMTEITEATLDTVLTTAQALKQKLAEYRLQREKEQKDRQDSHSRLV